MRPKNELKKSMLRDYARMVVVIATAKPLWAPYMAVWRVEELLRKATDALTKSGIPYAVM